MIYTAPDRSLLPTISQVLEMVKDIMSKMPIRHRMPYDECIDGDDIFLLNRTAMGYFTLKPNITQQPCLFYGDNDFHQLLQPQWNYLSREEYLIENVLREEFELTMESHPLYRLFLQGIPTRKLPVRINNPFGNALAYGFRTPMIPLTSSLDVAAFFATHSRDNRTGEWSAIQEHDSNGNINVGVLYLMELAVPFPAMPGLSCIGMQAFERPGLQRMYALNVEQGRNFNEHRFVYGFQFRQNPVEVRNIEEVFGQGEKLTPDELIADKAKDIIINRRVSDKAFVRNCKNNPREDPKINRKRLENAGVRIVQNDLHLFTEKELSEHFYPIAEAKWEEMFSHVRAIHPGFGVLLDDIRRFPNTDKGRLFFRK